MTQLMTNTEIKSQLDQQALSLQALKDRLSQLNAAHAEFLDRYADRARTLEARGDIRRLGVGQGYSPVTPEGNHFLAQVNRWQQRHAKRKAEAYQAY